MRESQSERSGRGKRSAFFLAAVLLAVVTGAVVTEWSEIRAWFRTREIAGEWYLYHVSIDAAPVRSGMIGRSDIFQHPFLSLDLRVSRDGRIQCGDKPPRPVDVGEASITVPPLTNEAFEAFEFQIEESGEWVLENSKIRARYRRGKRPLGAPPPIVEYRRQQQQWLEVF
ncbi:MAG: hypothetical protein AAF517_10615 [Planctomycetota bacterium]